VLLRSGARRRAAALRRTLARPGGHR